MVSRLRLRVRIFNSIQKSSAFLLRNLGSIKNPGESGESFSRLRPGESGFRQKSSAFLLREKTEYTHRLDLLTKSDSSKTTSPTHFLILPRGGFPRPAEEDPIVVLGRRKSFRISQSRNDARNSGSPGKEIPEFRPRNSRWEGPNLRRF